MAKVALEDVAVSPKQLVRINYLGTLLNRAVADRHAGSTRRHEWKRIYRELSEFLQEVMADDVH